MTRSRAKDKSSPAKKAAATPQKSKAKASLKETVKALPAKAGKKMAKVVEKIAPKTAATKKKASPVKAKATPKKSPLKSPAQKKVVQKSPEPKKAEMTPRASGRARKVLDYNAMAKGTPQESSPQKAVVTKRKLENTPSKTPTVKKAKKEELPKKKTQSSSPVKKVTESPQKAPVEPKQSTKKVTERPKKVKAEPEASPKKVTESPKKVQAEPKASPKKVSESSKKVQAEPKASSKKITASPKKALAKPVASPKTIPDSPRRPSRRVVESPKKEIPKKTPESPKKVVTESPKKAAESPKKAPESPKKTPESPKKAPESPKKANEPSKKAAEPEAKVVEKVQESPKKGATSPTKANKKNIETIDKTEEEPSKAPASPKKVTEVQDEVDCCPTATEIDVKPLTKVIVVERPESPNKVVLGQNETYNIVVEPTIIDHNGIPVERCHDCPGCLRKPCNECSFCKNGQKLLCIDRYCMNTDEGRKQREDAKAKYLESLSKAKLDSEKVFEPDRNLTIQEQVDMIMNQLQFKQKTREPSDVKARVFNSTPRKPRSAPVTPQGEPKEKKVRAKHKMLAVYGSSDRASKSRRCGECEGCMRDDCGNCAACRDKPRFGGKGSKKKACVARSCRMRGQPSQGEALVVAPSAQGGHQENTTYQIIVMKQDEAQVQAS